MKTTRSSHSHYSIHNTTTRSYCLLLATCIKYCFYFIYLFFCFVKWKKVKPLCTFFNVKWFCILFWVLQEEEGGILGLWALFKQDLEEEWEQLFLQLQPSLIMPSNKGYHIIFMGIMLYFNKLFFFFLGFSLSLWACVGGKLHARALPTHAHSFIIPLIIYLGLSLVRLSTTLDDDYYDHHHHHHHDVVEDTSITLCLPSPSCVSLSTCSISIMISLSLFLPLESGLLYCIRLTLPSPGLNSKGYSTVQV